MATKGYQAQAPAMPAAEGPAGSGGGDGDGNRAPQKGSKPRRGQVKEKIIKDMVAAVANLAAGLVRADKNGAGTVTGGLPAAGDADAK